MVDQFALASINIKPMVMMEYTGPDVTFEIPPKVCIEIFNAHGEDASYPSLATGEMKIKGREFVFCSFYSGSDESGEFIGIPNKIICLVLPTKVDAPEYISVVIKIASRMILDNDSIPQSTYIISKLIDSGTLTIPEELFEYIHRKIDERLDLNDKSKETAAAYEKEIQDYLEDDQKQYLRELEKVSEQEQLLADLQKKFKALEGEIADNEENEAARELLYEKIRQVEEQKKNLEKQMEGVKTSTQDYVQDLSRSLQEKIQDLQQKDMIIQQLQAQNTEIANSTRQYVEELSANLQMKIQECEQKDQIIQQFQEQGGGN
ncbi:MAG: hypothetical protein GF364_21880, partial [Candidatus Lokiarchaeota archaeon]|nr:hypothetical protein [Candidatus Lokiarchaeota archaeon]